MEVVFRPLVHADAEALARFLAGLSAESRRFTTYDGYDLAAARDLCDAIARHDKLRIVLEDGSSGRITGLLELGLALTPGDLARCRGAGITRPPEGGFLHRSRRPRVDRHDPRPPVSR